VPSLTLESMSSQLMMLTGGEGSAIFRGWLYGGVGIGVSVGSWGKGRICSGNDSSC